METLVTLKVSVVLCPIKPDYGHQGKNITESQ